MDNLSFREIILFEDEYLIAINKPAGLLSIEDGYDTKKINLRSILRDTYGAIWAVHRLDKYTSGVIIFAKDKNSHRKLNSSFSMRGTTKNYRGIINGVPIWNSYEISLPLRIDGDKKHRTIVDISNGKSAFTSFITLSSQGNYSYLDIFPRTGLTHQIRAHLSAIGFPILGDALYWRCCKFTKNMDFTPSHHYERYFLHAYSLKFAHPISNDLMTITTPLPISFTQSLSILKL